MRDLVILFIHLLTTVARLAGPGGIRSVVAESILVKHQLLILNRSRQRAPNLRLSDRKADFDTTETAREGYWQSWRVFLLKQTVLSPRVILRGESSTAAFPESYAQIHVKGPGGAWVDRLAFSGPEARVTQDRQAMLPSATPRPSVGPLAKPAAVNPRITQVTTPIHRVIDQKLPLYRFSPQREFAPFTPSGALAKDFFPPLRIFILRFCLKGEGNQVRNRMNEAKQARSNARPLKK